MARASRTKQAAERAASIDAFEAAFGAANEEAAESPNLPYSVDKLQKQQPNLLA